MMNRQVGEEYLLASLRTVLIVDEDEADLDYHSRLLEGQGHNLIACPSYSLGAELAERGGFDFAVIGQGGPGFEGWTVIERLSEHHPSIPFVVLARSKRMRCYLEAMQLGAADYLEKPVHPAEMKRILRDHLPDPLAAGL